MGATTVFGFKKTTNTWGSGLPVVVGAGDGLEIDSESLALAAELIEHVGLSGQGTQLPAGAGKRTVGGDIVFPMCYRGPDLMLALGMGTLVAPVQQGSSNAYLHGLRMASNRDGLYGTAVAGGTTHPVLRQWPFLKNTGWSLDVSESAQEAKLTVNAEAFDLNLTVADDDDRIVASAPVADGALTVAASPEYPSPINVTVTDADSSVTEFIILFSGLDEDGEFVQETYTLSTDTKTWTSDTRFSTVTTAVASGLAGTAVGDTVKVGTKNVNTPTTYTSISLPSTADYLPVTFGHLSVFINEQSGADFAASDEVYVSSISLKVSPALSGDVTTKFGNRIEEPTANGFQTVTFGFSFPVWNTANNPFIKTRMLAGKKKALIVFSGPEAHGGYPLQLRFFLNNLQFTSGSPNVGGPGKIPLDLEATAHRATASPTGLPAWANTQPLSAAVVNLRSTAMWA